MTRRTQFYIGLTIASGVALVAGCLASEGAKRHSDAYLVYCLLAWLSSTLKVRLPGITGTISVNFLFILIAIAVFTFSETFCWLLSHASFNVCGGPEAGRGSCRCRLMWRRWQLVAAPAIDFHIYSPDRRRPTWRYCWQLRLRSIHGGHADRIGCALPVAR